MDLLKQTKQLCKIYNIKPARSKGQNFLIKEDIYDKIVESANLKKEDVVLEVGPGLGFLTAKLAGKAKKVIAVELDDKLAEVLKIGLNSQGIKNVEVINENILDLDIDKEARFCIDRDPISKFSKLPKGNFENLEIGSLKTVANLPYNITSIFLRKFLSAERKPELMVLMLQKEVAERIIAKPGKMSLLAVSVQFYAKPEIIQVVSKNNFWPEPKVDSAIVKITPTPNPSPARSSRERGIEDKAKNKGVKIASHSCDVRSGRETEREGIKRKFFRLVKIGFSAKRKMLKNNLANGYHISHEKAEDRLKRAGFSGKIRAQELSVDDWLKLLESFN